MKKRDPGTVLHRKMHEGLGASQLCNRYISFDFYFITSLFLTTKMMGAHCQGVASVGYLLDLNSEWLPTFSIYKLARDTLHLYAIQRRI